MHSGNKGFTLIEMAVVLAVIAILAAILTPIITSYVDQARTARAGEDVEKISQAFLLHYRDTGRYPIWDTVTVANTGTTPSKNCLTSGTSATLPTDASTGSSWTTSSPNCTAGNLGLIQNYLNINTLGYATGNVPGGAISYRGPYLDGLNSNDPWGNPYVVTSAWLATSGSQSLNWAFTISAGPNGQLDTKFNQPRSSATLSVSSDDIVALIH
jgi:prepilin-type N-terminal cleavage/methylation domain-containing protein